MADKYPECEKWAAIPSDQRQAEAELLEWLEYEGLAKIRHSVQDVLFRFHNIDPDKIEQERAAMLADIRAREANV